MKTIRFENFVHYIKIITIAIYTNYIAKHLNRYLVMLNLGKSNCSDGNILSTLVQKTKTNKIWQKLQKLRFCRSSNMMHEWFSTVYFSDVDAHFQFISF